MKKYLCLLLALIMLLSLASCAGKKDPAPAEPTESAEPAPEPAPAPAGTPEEPSEPDQPDQPDKTPVDYVGQYLDIDTNQPGLRIVESSNGGYLVQVGIYRLTSLDDGRGEMKPDGLHFTATDASGNPISGLITCNGEVAAVIITDSTWDLLQNGSTFLYKKVSDKGALWDAVDPHNPTLAFIGRYSADRAFATVQADGAENARITIDWANSAQEQVEWVIVGPLDSATMTVNYTDCVKTTRVYSSTGAVESETVDYTDGTGRIVFGDNATFSWEEDQGAHDSALIFEWVQFS